ncbi:MAG: response regulator transcription factor, partial [Terriglobales bacterium]
MAENPIQILIADDHPIFRDGLRRLLESEPHLQVVGEASDGRQAIEMVGKTKPDILLLDVAMSNLPGLEALRELSEAQTPVKVIILTASIERRQMLIALQLGALGIVLKESATQVLMKSIETVQAGGYWVGKASVPDLKELVLQDMPAVEQEPSGEKWGLTKREMQMVAAIVEGCSNRDMAQKFGVREDTVKHHLTSIFSKLGVATRLELALFALEHKMVPKEGSGVRQASGS